MDKRSNQFETGRFVTITVGNFKETTAYVKSYRADDDSYELGKASDENHPITKLRWYHNELKLT